MLSAASLVVFLVLGNRVMVDVDVVGGRDDTRQTKTAVAAGCC